MLRFYISFALLLLTVAGYAQEIPVADTSVIDTAGISAAATTIDTNTVKAMADTGMKAISQTTTVTDTLSAKKKPFEPNAKKAGMYSSILPGLGQTYNRQYWKIPIVYAILGTAGYFIGFNYNRYSDYRLAYIAAIDGDPATEGKYPLYEAGDLQRLQNQAKKDLDILVLLTSVGYALQIMDAVASAHLKNFDISRDISMKVQPVIQPNFVGMGLVMNFK